MEILPLPKPQQSVSLSYSIDCVTYVRSGPQEVVPRTWSIDGCLRDKGQSEKHLTVAKAVTSVQEEEWRAALIV